jgi:hypothetical protein
LRPPFAQERLRRRGDGRVALELKRAWHDGTRELLFEPMEFLETAPPRARSWAALMHRAFGIDVLACAHCGGRLRLIATLHDPAVILRILAPLALGHSGQSPGPARPSRGRRRRVLIGSAGARRPPWCWRREVAVVLIRPVHRSIDGGRLSGLACRSPGSARWTDGIYVKAGLEKDKAAMLVLIAALRDGRQVMLAVESGYRESIESWAPLSRDLKARGLRAPQLLVADGYLGIWGW